MLDDSIPTSEYIAVLRMLIRRATWLDKWRARKRPGHWLNGAKRELIIEHGTLSPYECALQILREMSENQHDIQPRSTPPAK
jgi:hypothetical protein